MNISFHGNNAGKIALRSSVGAALLLSILGLTGCATSAAFTPAGPPNNTFLLDTEFPATVPAIAPGKIVLIVTLPQARSGFDTRRIAYTKTPLTINYYAESEWADTPALMLAPLIVSCLEKNGGFRAVLSESAPLAGDLRLDTDILRLQQEFLEQPSRVRLTLRVKLYDIARREIIATKILEATQPAPSEDAYGGAQAANSVIHNILLELIEFVIAHGNVDAGR